MYRMAVYGTRGYRVFFLPDSTCAVYMLCIFLYHIAVYGSRGYRGFHLF